MHALAVLLLSLPLASLAGHSHSHHRRHREARGTNYARRGVTFKLEDDYSGQNFFDGWTFFDAQDPTNGAVNYLSQSDAVKAGLAYVQSDNTTVLAVDDYTTLQSGQNRNSVRIQTTKTYNGGLFIADFYAMPHGCSVWPAYWTVGEGTWPDAGEMDIIEGVNLNTANQITMHTGPTCSLSNTDAALAHLQSPTCTSSPSSNSGCAFTQSGNNSFGHQFNMQAGGVFAHNWDSTGISVWFFPRGQVPDDITNGNPDPSSWGAPTAMFPNNDSCGAFSQFANHQIVLDTTLCGDWAGNAFNSAGCPGSCADYVADPSNFKLAKWMVSSIRVYQPSS